MLTYIFIAYITVLNNCSVIIIDNTDIDVNYLTANQVFFFFQVTHNPSRHEFGRKDLSKIK